MPQVTEIPKKNRHMLAWVVVVVVIVVLAGALVAYLLLMHRGPSGPSAADVRRSAQTLDDEHDYSQEQQTLANFMASKPPMTDKPDLYWIDIQLANLAS